MMPFVFWGTINLSVASQAFIAEEDGEGFVSATEESCNVAHENCGGQ
jgi:hypothetical protein